MKTWSAPIRDAFHAVGVSQANRMRLPHLAVQFDMIADGVVRLGSRLRSAGRLDLHLEPLAVPSGRLAYAHLSAWPALQNELALRGVLADGPSLEGNGAAPRSTSRNRARPSLLHWRLLFDPSEVGPGARTGGRRTPAQRHRNWPRRLVACAWRASIIWPDKGRRSTPGRRSWRILPRPVKLVAGPHFRSRQGDPVPSRTVSQQRFVPHCWMPRSTSMSGGRLRRSSLLISTQRWRRTGWSSVLGRELPPCLTQRLIERLVLSVSEALSRHGVAARYGAQVDELTPMMVHQLMRESNDLFVSEDYELIFFAHGRGELGPRNRRPCAAPLTSSS